MLVFAFPPSRDPPRGQHAQRVCARGQRGQHVPAGTLIVLLCEENFQPARYSYRYTSIPVAGGLKNFLAENSDWG